MIRKSRMLELAQNARKYFVLGKREKSGESYWYTTDDAPDWVTKMCYEAHGNMLPDEYKYQFIVESLDALIEAEGDRDSVELEADCYTSDLTAWLASKASRTEYVDQAAEEFDELSAGIVNQLMQGQYLEKREVFDSIVNSLIEADKEVA